jgi:hypothetical protein
MLRHAGGGTVLGPKQLFTRPHDSLEARTGDACMIEFSDFYLGVKYLLESCPGAFALGYCTQKGG